MTLWNKINGKLSGAINAVAPRSAGITRTLAAYLLIAVSLSAGSPTALGQGPSPSPEKIQVPQLPMTAQLVPSPSPTPAKESDAVGQSPVSTSQTKDQST